MIRIRTALLAEHVVFSNDGLPTVLTIFDGLFPKPTDQGLVLAPYMIFVALEASSEVGPEHMMHLRLIDEDGQEYGSVGPSKINFVVKRDRTGLASLYRHSFLSPHPIPAPGSYLWEIRVDDVRIGELSLTVHEPLEVPKEEEEEEVDYGS